MAIYKYFSEGLKPPTRLSTQYVQIDTCDMVAYIILILIDWHACIDDATWFLHELLQYMSTVIR